MWRLRKRAHVLQHAVARLVAERVVDLLELVDVDEQQRQRQLEARVPLQLAVHHLLEEPAVVAAGQRIGDRRLQQLLPRRFEPAVGHPQLVGHVLEHELVNAERAEGVEHGVDDEDLERELAGRQHAAAPTTAVVRFETPRPSSTKRDEPGADHPALDQHRRVHRRRRRRAAIARDEIAGRQHGAGAEQQRREQEPGADRDQDPQPRRADEPRLPVEVGAPEEQRRRADAEKLRQADARSSRRSPLS